MSYFGGPLVPLFWSGDISSRFPSQIRFYLICIVEVNVIYTLPTSWRSALWGGNLRQWPNVATYQYTPQALALNQTLAIHTGPILESEASRKLV